MIERTIFAVSKDELRPALMGVLFEIKPEELRLVATDGHRLSRTIFRDFRSESNVQFIVPTKSLTLLDKNIRQDGGEVEIRFSENYVSFYQGDMRIHSRLVESDYPEYEPAIPTGSNRILVVNKEEFLSSIRRVSIFSGLIANQVVLNISGNEMEVFSYDIEVGGEGRERIPVEFEGDPIEIAFNAEYLMDVIKHVETENVKILMSGSMFPVLVLPTHQDENEDHLMLVMPVRIEHEEEEKMESESFGYEGPGEENLSGEEGEESI